MSKVDKHNISEFIKDVRVSSSLEQIVAFRLWLTCSIETTLGESPLDVSLTLHFYQSSI